MKAQVLPLGIVLFMACGDDGQSVMPDAPPMIDAGPGPADQIGVVAGSPLPSGSWLLASRWAPSPNAVIALDPDDLGGTPHVVFTANRVWSMGAYPDASTIVFSGHDPMREMAFGLTLLDSIQNSFAYDRAAGTVTQLAPPGSGWENVNDECFEPSLDGAYVYVCRRYDFTSEPAFKGWRIGRIRIADGSFEFLRDESPTGPFELTPQELPGGTHLLFEMRDRGPSTGASLHVRELATGTETMVRADAWRPKLAPDGHTVLFSDTNDQSRYKTFDLDQPNAPIVTVSPTVGVGDAAWSPDGQTIIYTVFDQALTCEHVERVTWMGSEWSTPERLRDCANTGEVLTTLAWVTVP